MPRSHGLYISYCTDYPNQVHQLIVSVSKRVYVLKNRELKFQKKPVDINLDNFQKAERNLLIHYIIRDHFSNAFYGEIHEKEAPEDVRNFLYRAWSQKEDYPFCGIPDSMIVTKTVQRFAPEIVDLLSRLNVKIIDSTSGFQAGIRIIRTWEEELKFHYKMAPELKTIEDVQFNIDRFCNYINNRSKRNKASNITIWENDVKDLRLPKAEDFLLRNE